ncbi:MAG: T9SS type A sorting domain-containing protein, partial [Emcibacteraceae bacterium]|nr:T9SS type A sorting domain-containing protein [Emcibacteraceae bacterium]
GCSAGAGGNGSYKLTLNSTNETLAQLLEADADFGMESIKEFCYPPLGISEINLENLITLFPNPGANALNVKSKELKLQSIQIYSLTGKEVMNVAVSGNNVELNTTDLPASFYLMKIVTDKGELNQRWIKQ